MKKTLLPILFLHVALSAAMAQSVPGLLNPGPQPNAAAADPLGRDTPSGTVLGFLQAAQAGNFRGAADYLQMSAAHRQAQGSQLAAQLKTVMDRREVFTADLRRVSARPEGSQDVSGSIDEQTIGTFSSGETEIPVVLVRVNVANSGKIWLFSAETLSKVPELYDNLQVHQIEKRLPPSLLTSFLGLPLWQWLALLAAVPIAALAGWLIVLILAVPRLLWIRLRHRPQLISYRHVSPPLLMFFAALVHRAIAAYLDLPLLPRVYYYRAIDVIMAIGFFWLLLRAAGLTMQRLRRHAVGAGRIGAGTLMLLGERLLNAVVVGIAILAVLAIFGFNLTTVLAGLGIGGLAIAFAAQKTLENLFGGVSLLADEVLRVGDVCRIGDRIGTVEDISLRSTRLRTADRTELSIPNGSLATMNLENFTRRDKILFNPTLGIRYETTPDQLRYLLAELRRMLYEHPKIEASNARVRLIGLETSSLSVEIFSYVLSSDFAEFTAIREDLLLRIIEIVNRAGTGFAFPSHTLYMSRDEGLNRQKVEAAEHQVEQWRNQNQLPFPDFAPEDKAAFRGSIVYPPSESAVGRERP